MNINIINDEVNSNDFLIIFDQLKARPNVLVIQDSFSGTEFLSVLDKYKKIDESNHSVIELLPSNNVYVINEKVLSKIDETLWISYVEINRNSDFFIINDVCFYYKDDKNIVDSIISETNSCKFNYDTEIDKINTLSFCNGSIDIEPLKVSFDAEIESMFTRSNLKSINKLIKGIKHENKGLSILSGEKGLGKTTICKYIASKVDRMTLFIPNNMIDQSINNPEFRNFIKKFDKCLLIIDDCEFLYSPLYGKMNAFTNNILQLVDGFLSDNLNLHILLSFNQLEDDIDENLIDSNSLLDIINFDLLDIETSNSLNKELGRNNKFKNKARLVDVFKNKNKSTNIKIGLK